MDININQGNVDPSKYLQQPTGVESEQPGIVPIRKDIDDVVEAAGASGINQSVLSQLHLAPVLFKNPQEVQPQNTAFTLRSESGKPLNYPQPNRYNDMMAAANQLSENGEIPLQDFIKTVQDAITALQQELEEQQNNSNQIDKEFNKTNLATYEEIKKPPPVTTNPDVQVKQTMTAAQIQDTATKIAAGTNETTSVQAMLDKLLGGSNLDPKISEMILALAQLQYLQRNESKNASGGIIIGNHPELMLTLKNLGIELPTPNPNVPFAGMSIKLANQNKAPYNDPAYKELAKTLPKGWEVISPAEIQVLTQNIAAAIRTTAGDAYGILAKPLQGLFGSSLFATSDNRGKIAEIRKLDHLKKLLLEYKNLSYTGRIQFVKDHKDEFQEAVDKKLINYMQTPMYLQSTSNAFDNKFNFSVFEMVIKRYNKSINDRGGMAMVYKKEPPPTDGLGRLASGAVVGGMTDSISNILDSLFNTEMNNNFNNSTLPVKDKKNIQQLASITLMTTVLGDALHSDPVFDAKGSHDKLSNAIQAFKDSGAAQRLLDAVFNSSNGTSSLSEYQNEILEEATQAFMINIGAITATASDTGINPSKAFSTLTNLRSNSAISSEVKSAQAFWETSSDQLSDATKFNALAHQLAPTANHDGASVESQESLREMIKLLKKMLEQLLSGGQSTQQLGDAITKVKEGMGALNISGFSQDIHG